MKVSEISNRGSISRCIKVFACDLLLLLLNGPEKFQNLLHLVLLNLARLLHPIFLEVRLLLRVELVMIEIGCLVHMRECFWLPTTGIISSLCVGTRSRDRRPYADTLDRGPVAVGMPFLPRLIFARPWLPSQAFGKIFEVEHVAWHPALSLCGCTVHRHASVHLYWDSCTIDQLPPSCLLGGRRTSCRPKPAPPDMSLSDSCHCESPPR